VSQKLAFCNPSELKSLSKCFAERDVNFFFFFFFFEVQD
jgi:hypothetical protein